MKFLDKAALFRHLHLDKFALVYGELNPAEAKIDEHLGNETEWIGLGCSLPCSRPIICTFSHAVPHIRNMASHDSPHTVD